MEIYKEIVKICNELAKKKIIKVSTLGKIENYKLILVEIKKKSKINGLITAGFHGNETAPFTACTETPGKEDFNLRVKANLALIKSFIRFLNNFDKNLENLIYNKSK
jgi:hypothetical protein